MAVHGDNLLAEFASVVDAVQCAVEIQNELKARNEELPEESRMPFRIGINLGDVIEEDGNIYGDGVNVASRLESLAEAGGICISRSVHDHVKNKLGIGYQSLGAHSVKNIAEPVQVYRVLPEPDAFGKAVGKVWYRLRQWQKVALAVAVALLPVFANQAVKKYMDQPAPSPGIFSFLGQEALPLPDKPSIAVLPFENMTGDPKQEYFTDGFTEQIITSLSKISSLFVISRNSSFTYKGKPVKLKKVSKELGVRYVLEGSIQKSGDRVRINAQLIDAISDQHLWAENYDRDMKDIFALQDEIILKILTALQVNLTSGEQARVWAKGTKNLEAYLKLMQARESILQGDEASTARARQLIEETIALDPQYAHAYMYMGATHMTGLPARVEQIPQGIPGAGDRMDAKGPGHGRLAGGSPRPAGPPLYVRQPARRSHRRSGEGDGDGPQFRGGALHGVSRPPVLRKAGGIDPGVQEVDPPRALRPRHLLREPGDGLFHERHRLRGSRSRRVEKGLERAPDGMIVHFMATTVYSACGKEKEARKTAKELLRISPKFSAESFAKRLPQIHQKDKDRITEALQKAGL